MDKVNFNNKRYVWVVVAIILIIILFVATRQSSVGPVSNESTTTTETQTSGTSVSGGTSGTKTNTGTSGLLSAKCNLKISYPLAYSRASFPLVIKGTVDLSGKKYPCTWNENNQVAGTVQVFYNIANTGWKAPGVPVLLYSESSNASSTHDVSSGIISLNSFALGIPSGTPVKLHLIELNINDNKNPNTFDIIVYLK